jgi:hypothetical protein
MEAYEKENGIATKGGLNMLYHVFEVSQQVSFKGALEFRKNSGVGADGTSSSTGVNRGFFTLLQLVTVCQGRKLLRNNCLGHRIALVMNAAESVDYPWTIFACLFSRLSRNFSSLSITRPCATRPCKQPLSISGWPRLLFSARSLHGGCLMASV